MRFKNTRAPEREEDVEISAPAGKYRVLVHTGARVEVLIERPDSEAGRADALRYLRASSRPAALARGTTVIQWGARAKSFEDALRTAARRDAKPEAAPAARPVAKVVPAEPMPEREPPRDHEAEHDAAVEATRREASAQLRGMSSQTTLMQALEEDLSETDTAPTRCELCHVESPDHLLSCANLPTLPLVAAVEPQSSPAAPTAASSSTVPQPREPRPAAPTEECAVEGCSMLVGKVRPHAHPQLKVLCPVHRSKGGYVLVKHPDIDVAAWLSEGRHTRQSKPVAS